MRLPFHEVLMKYSLRLTLQLLACTSHVAFSWEPLHASFLQTSCETALIFIAYLIIH